MKQFAIALNQLKSYKHRQKCFSESLDNLSFNYPNLYSVLYREIRRRETESNDPNKMSKWLSTLEPNSYVKLHEALMLVKSHNIKAKEKYMHNIRSMICRTIESGTNIEIVMKICYLIEKSPHLKSIHENLIQYIEQIKQMNQGYISGYNQKQMHTKSTLNNKINSKQILINPLEHLNFQWCTRIQPQQQYTFIWPTMPQLTRLNTSPGFPLFSLEFNDYNYPEMIATANRHSTFDVLQVFSTLTIVSQEMDGVVTKWLYYLKLHNYQWFFNQLSYLEIEFIDEDNIDGFINKVNGKAITKGAQKKICISTSTLRGRKQKFQDLLMTLDLEVTPYELCEIFTYMRDILHYPIPNRNCVVGDQLQQDIVLIMEKSLNQLMEKLNGTRYLVSSSLLGTSINKYLECILLITGNQIFMKEQINKIVIFDKILKYKVYKMPKNFY